MNITEYVKHHREGFKKPKSAILERWNTRVIPRKLHTQGRIGAANYLASYGKGIASLKVVELALTAEAMGAPEMAAGFWEKAFELETGALVRFDAGTGEPTASIPVVTARTLPAIVLHDLPPSFQPGRIATMQATDTKLNRTAFILNPEYVGQPKRDGHHDVLLATSENAVHQSRSTSVMAPFSLCFDNAAKAVAASLGAFVIDGERYFRSANGAEHRSAAQAAEQNIKLDKAHVQPVPVYAIFKALFANGRPLLDVTELERIEAAKPIGEALIAALRGTDCEVEILPTAQTVAEKQALADRQQAEGREGEVWVKRDCAYTGGKAHKTDIVRTKYFIEIKVRVTGLTSTTAAGRLFGSIEVADLQTGRPLGSVGTGFNSDDSQRVAALFATKPNAAIIEVRTQFFTEGDNLWHARLIGILD